MSDKGLPNTLLKGQFDLLVFAEKKQKFTNIRCFQDAYPYSYSMANSSEKSLLAIQCVTESNSSKRLSFKITAKGTRLLAACKNGTTAVKSNNSRNKPSGQKEIVSQSSHDAIAEGFIAEMAQPVAMNSQLNNCLSSVYGIVSDFLAAFPVELPQITKLDKHNHRILKLIQSINEQCEDHHGKTTS